MKSWLNVSTGDLGTVNDKTMLHHTKQKAQISRDTAFQKARVQLRHQLQFWLEVVRNISYGALKEVFCRYQLSHSMPVDIPACTGSCMAILGIPCCHMMKRMVADIKKPRMTDFRHHWWLQQSSLAMADAVPNESFENTMSKIVEKHANLAPHQQPILLKMLTGIVEGDIIATVVNSAMDCGRGRPPESTKFSSQRSTQRDPSAFGYVILRERVL